MQRHRVLRNHLWSLVASGSFLETSRFQVTQSFTKMTNGKMSLQHWKHILQSFQNLTCGPWGILYHDSIWVNFWNFTWWNHGKLYRNELISVLLWKILVWNNRKTFCWAFKILKSPIIIYCFIWFLGQFFKTWCLEISKTVNCSFTYLLILLGQNTFYQPFHLELLFLV